jgi:hypothetical protein
VLGAALAAWFVLLNALTAWAALPDVLSGRTVEVAITSCGAGSCRGDYRLAGVTHVGRDVLGVSSARAGSVLRATVDGQHPGSATVDDPAETLAEALVLALFGLAIALLAARSGHRAWRRRAVGEERAERVVAEGDDPLAWVRRRRFGAGG